VDIVVAVNKIKRFVNCGNFLGELDASLYVVWYLLYIIFSLLDLGKKKEERQKTSISQEISPTMINRF